MSLFETFETLNVYLYVNKAKAILVFTSVHQELVGGPHHLRGGDLLQEPGLLRQLLLCLLLHLAGAGLVVVKQSGEGGEGGQRLNSGVH